MKSIKPQPGTVQMLEKTMAEQAFSYKKTLDSLSDDNKKKNA